MQHLIKPIIMTRQETILKEIAALESKLTPLRQELKTIQDPNKVAKLKAKYSTKDMVYSAVHRCICGMGLAYPKFIGNHGSWDCAGLLLGNHKETEGHSSYSFARHGIVAEGDSTTRKCITYLEENKLNAAKEAKNKDKE